MIPRLFLLLGLAGILANSLRAASASHIVKVAFEQGSILEVEVADTPQSRRTGLMYRTELPEGWGMLFVFEAPDLQSFWMKNTHVPLDIAFIDSEGKITNIRSMRPLDTTTRHRSRGRVPYALEVPQGWFQAQGIRAGSRVQFLRRPFLPGEPRPQMPLAGELILPTPEELEKERRRMPAGLPFKVQTGDFKSPSRKKDEP